MILFRDEDILRYLHNEMEYTEVADFEAALDVIPDMQNHFEEILERLAIAHDIQDALNEDGLQHILWFALGKNKVDGFKPTHQSNCRQYR